MIISVGGKEAPTIIDQNQSGRIRWRIISPGAVARSIAGCDAISAVRRQSIAGSSAGKDSPVKKTPQGECPIAALSPSRVTDEANFGWRCWRRGCPRTRGGSGAGGVAQIAAGIDAFTRHTVCSVSKTR